MHVQLRAPSSHLWHRWGSGLACKTRNLYNPLTCGIVVNFPPQVLVKQYEQEGKSLKLKLAKYDTLVMAPLPKLLKLLYAIDTYMRHTTFIL